MAEGNYASELIQEALAARQAMLRDILLRHHPIMRSEDSPFSGCRCGQVKLGEDVIRHVIEQLTAPASEKPVTTCKCILATHPEFEGHTQEDHSKSPCSGSWGYDPPCGGCINCLASQAYHYQDKP